MNHPDQLCDATALGCIASTGQVSCSSVKVHVGLPIDNHGHDALYKASTGSAGEHKIFEPN